MKKGFTLVEILLVCAIIGILTSIAVPNIFSAMQRGQATEGVELLAAFHASALRYMDMNNITPVGIVDLDILPPTGNAKYFKSPPGVNGFGAVITRVQGGANLYTLYMDSQAGIKCDPAGACPQGFTNEQMSVSPDAAALTAACNGYGLCIAS